MNKLATGLAALMAAAALALPAPARASAARTTYVTWYGWPDNDPPGNAIAYPRSDGYPTRHSVAGGYGSYANPLTLATDPREIPVGTRVYVPSMRRYFVMEDWCAECARDWSHGHRWHVDLWVGGMRAPAGRVLAEEDALTRDAARVIIRPPADLPVDTRPLVR